MRKTCHVSEREGHGIYHASQYNSIYKYIRII